MNRNAAGLSLVLTLMPAIAVSQNFGAESIPEPTRLGADASNPDSDVVLEGIPRQISSSGGTIDIAIAQLSVSGRTDRGIRISLASEDRADSLYLDVTQASQFREELEGLESLGERACAGKGNCTFGIARCGPARILQQAYCPAIYYTIDGETGFALSTPRNDFRFHGVRAAELASAVEAVAAGVGDLESEASD